MKNHNNLFLVLLLIITLSLTIVYFSPSILSGEKNLNNTSNNLGNDSNPEVEKVIVKSGDTLWNLARRYYNTNIDLREVIFRIKEVNNLSNSDLKPGQQIKIPLE